jgi:hypothetical protein
MPRVQGVFQELVGFNTHAFRLIKPLDDKLTATIRVECTFDPFNSIIEYDLDVTEPTPQGIYRVNQVYGAKALEWSESLYKELFDVGEYRVNETLKEFLERMTEAKTKHRYRAIQWIQWDKLMYLMDLFGTNHNDRRFFTYVQQQELLARPLREWLLTEQALCCPYRIHPEVLRAYIRDDQELVDEVAMVEEIKYAMCHYQTRVVTGQQLMRAYNYCTDVEGSLVRLIKRGVLKDQTLEELIIVSFALLATREEVVVDPGQPLEPFVHTLQPWSVLGIRDYQSPIYQAFDADPKTKAKRVFLEYSSGQAVNMFNDIKTFCSIVKPTRVVFIFAYDASPGCLALYDSYWFTPWKWMRTRRTGELVSVHRTEHQQYRLFKQVEDKKPSITYPNGLELGLNLYSAQVIQLVHTKTLDDIAKADVVFFMSKQRTPRRWRDYVDRAVGKETRMCVVGEQPKL